MKIGDQIRKARNRMGMSQDDLAERIHVSRGKISHWETGLRPPKAEEIRELEEVLQCKFEIEQEQAQSPEGQAAESTDLHGEAASSEKKPVLHALLQKSVPAWLCAAIVGGVFTVMLVIMLCTTSNLQKQIEALTPQPAEVHTPAWYQVNTQSEPGKAYVSIMASSDPVQAIPDPGDASRNVWLYELSAVEENGIPFMVEEIIFETFSGDVSKNVIPVNMADMIRSWGNNTIPANGKQVWGSGMPVQPVTSMGIVMRGKDVNGNALEFRGIVNFSQELAE